MAPSISIHSRAYAAELTAKKYWEFRHSNSLDAEFVGGYADVDQTSNGVPNDFTEGYGRALVRFSHALKPAESVSQSRFELTLQAISRGVENTIPRGGGVNELSVSWARRNAWGALRLGAGYAW
jgi:hypothetical protein